MKLTGEFRDTVGTGGIALGRATEFVGSCGYQILWVKLLWGVSCRNFRICHLGNCGRRAEDTVRSLTTQMASIVPSMLPQTEATASTSHSCWTWTHCASGSLYWYVQCRYSCVDACRYYWGPC